MVNLINIRLHLRKCDSVYIWTNHKCITRFAYTPGNNIFKKKKKESLGVILVFISI